MKPDWNKLGAEFKDHPSVLIADADCTVESELCSKHGVQGYPTIKYFTAENPEGASYNGGRDFDSLKKFTVDTLQKKCEVADGSNCDDKEKAYIEKMKGKSAEELKKQVTRLEGMKDNSMKADLKGWLLKRLAILQQLSAAA